MTTRTIDVDYLARVEGEGALKLRFVDGALEEAKLSIFEPPRFYEALMVGRAAGEAPDITARICGICPVAYQLSAIAAVEDAWGLAVPEPIAALRRLLLCGEWISSHGLHITMLHAPDFLGYPDAVAMAKTHGDEVRRGLALKQVGNAIMDLVGGREIHPVNVRVGGFYRAPYRDEFDELAGRVDRAVAAARQMVDWVAGFDFPAFEMDYELVSIRTPGAYPLAPGRVVSNRGIDIAPAAYGDTFQEIHKAHSTALHSVVPERGTYLTGPLARFALNHGNLNPLAAEAARRVGTEPLGRNPFMSIVVRAIEVLHACEEAARLIAAYRRPDDSFVAGEPRAGVGHGVIEAPRGVLYQRYHIDAEGTVLQANIVPPTAQNQGSIEADLRVVASRLAAEPDDTIRSRCEQAIRNHDPCISCATHFLRLEVERA